MARFLARQAVRRRQQFEGVSTASLCFFSASSLQIFGMLWTVINACRKSTGDDAGDTAACISRRVKKRPAMKTISPRGRPNHRRRPRVQRVTHRPSHFGHAEGAKRFRYTCVALGASNSNNAARQERRLSSHEHAHAHVRAIETSHPLAKTGGTLPACQRTAPRSLHFGCCFESSKTRISQNLRENAIKFNT